MGEKLGRFSFLSKVSPMILMNALLWHSGSQIFYFKDPHNSDSVQMEPNGTQMVDSICTLSVTQLSGHLGSTLGSLDHTLRPTGVTECFQ